MRDSSEKRRNGKAPGAFSVGAAVRVLFGGVGFAVFFWFLAGADSSVEWGYVALFMGLGSLGMAALEFFGRRRGAARRSRLGDRVGMPDSLQATGERDPESNVENALRGLNPPKDAKVVVGHSIMSSRILLLVLLAVGSGLLFVGLNRESLFPGWHVSASYLLNGFGGLLVLIAIWPSNWRKQLIGLIAVRTGIYAHGQGNNPDGHEWATPETRWLFVPWTNVVDVREGRVWKPGGQSGGTWWPSTKLTLRVTPGEARDWFPHAEREPSGDGNSRIVSLDYADSDSSPDDTVPKLKRLRASSQG